jgi:hypothetical protein
MSLFYILVGTNSERKFDDIPFVTFEKPYEIREETEKHYVIFDDGLKTDL